MPTPLSVAIGSGQSSFLPRERTIGKTFTSNRPFRFGGGGVLPSITIAYETYGRLNAKGTNVVLVCHALTGNAHATDDGTENETNGRGWWSGLIGRGKAIDTTKYFVVCSNFLGSCYGSSGPASTNPVTGSPYAMDFPDVSVRDMVLAQKLLLDHLGVSRIAAVIGGSLGGMQVLEWAILFPGMVERIIPIATAARHSAWCIGLSETSRLAIMSDPVWEQGNYREQPGQGLALARMIAMISYRSRLSFEQRFSREEVDSHTDLPSVFREIPHSFQIESYLRYQGQKLVHRFDANSYIYITRSMDAHDVGKGRGGWKEALASIGAKTLSIALSSDILYPPAEQQTIVDAIPGAYLHEIESVHGHDGFLIEFDQLNPLIQTFLRQ